MIARVLVVLSLFVPSFATATAAGWQPLAGHCHLVPPHCRPMPPSCCPVQNGFLLNANDDACPTEVIAEFPSANGETLCLWRLKDCTSNSEPESIYASCSGNNCSCVNGKCISPNQPPQTDPATAVSVNDDIQGTTLGFSPATVVTRKRNMRSNKRVIPHTPQAPARLIPTNAGDIMTGWGKSGYVVSYQKCLKLMDGSSAQYFALYRIYRPRNANTDSAYDVYVGQKLASTPTSTPGGLVTRSVRSANYKMLKANTNGDIVEGVVKVPAQVGNTTGNPNKWFQLYGVSH